MPQWSTCSGLQCAKVRGADPPHPDIKANWAKPPGLPGRAGVGRAPGRGVRPAPSHSLAPTPRRPSATPLRPRPRSAQPARRGNPPQSRAYVHRAGSAPSPGGPRALRSAACCRRSAGATPIRYRRMGTATGSRWTAGYPSSARRLGAWGLACMGGAGVGRPVCKLPPLPPSSPTPSPPPPFARKPFQGESKLPALTLPWSPITVGGAFGQGQYHGPRWRWG